MTPSKQRDTEKPADAAEFDPLAAHGFLFSGGKPKPKATAVPKVKVAIKSSVKPTAKTIHKPPPPVPGPSLQATAKKFSLFSKLAASKPAPTATSAIKTKKQRRREGAFILILYQ